MSRLAERAARLAAKKDTTTTTRTTRTTRTVAKDEQPKTPRSREGLRRSRTLRDGMDEQDYLRGAPPFPMPDPEDTAKDPDLRLKATWSQMASQRVDAPLPKRDGTQIRQVMPDIGCWRINPEWKEGYTSIPKLKYEQSVPFAPEVKHSISPHAVGKPRDKHQSKGEANVSAWAYGKDSTRNRSKAWDRFQKARALEERMAEEIDRNDPQGVRMREEQKLHDEINESLLNAIFNPGKRGR